MFTASLLVVVGLAVENVQEVFFKMYSTVFRKDGYIPAERAPVMSIAIEGLLMCELFMLSERTRLNKATIINRCKTCARAFYPPVDIELTSYRAIFFVASVQMDQYRLFRNYGPIATEPAPVLIETILSA